MSEKVSCNDFETLGTRAKMLFDHINDMCSKYANDGFSDRDSMKGFQNRITGYTDALAQINDAIYSLTEAGSKRVVINNVCNRIV